MAELQCVILALPSPIDSPLQSLLRTPAFRGSGLPLNMLPVANQPLLLYQLRHIERTAGSIISSIIIVVGDSEHEVLLNDAINSMRIGIKCEVVVFDPHAVSRSASVSAEAAIESTGSAEVLRSLRAKLHSDFFVISTPDLLTETSILQLVDVHRIHDATCTMLLHQTSQTSTTSGGESGVELFKNISVHGGALPGGGNDEDFASQEILTNTNKNQGSFFGLHVVSPSSPSSEHEPNCQTSRIVLAERIDGPKRNAASALDEDRSGRNSSNKKRTDSLFVEKSLLKICPRIAIHTDLQDMHLYLFRNWILDLLDEREDFISIEDDLIPFLISGQFQRYVLPEKLILSGKLEPKQKLAHSMSSHRTEFKNDLIKCFALTITPSTSSSAAANKPLIPPPYCANVRDLASYHRINLDIMNLHSNIIWEKPNNYASNTFKGCLIGKDWAIGDQVNLKNCIIGSNCKIGTRCKLNNCVVMDNVTMEGDVVVQNSIICSSAYIKEKSNLNECVVESGVQVKCGKVKGAIFRSQG